MLFQRTRREEKQLSVLAMDCDFVGNLTYSGVLEVKGRVEGDVVVNGTVVVSPSGSCLGNIKADTVEISGEVRGKVLAKELRLVAGGKLVGDGTFGHISVDEGAVFVRQVPLDTGEVPVSQSVLSQTESNFPERKKESGKAGNEPKPNTRENPKKPRFQTIF